MTPESWRRRTGGPWWARIVALLLLAGLVRLGWDLASHWQKLGAAGAFRFSFLLALRGAALASGLWALLGWWRGSAPTSRVSPGGWLRAAAVILLSAIAAGTLAELVSPLDDDRFAVSSAYRSALLLGTAFWLSSLRRPRRGEAAQTAGAVGVVAVNLLATLVVLEAVALGFSWLRPTRLLWNERSTRAAIDANRLEPGAPYLGFPVNSRGYYDEEFERAGPGDLVVAVVADSFGVGIVPFKHNFTSVMERRLARRVPVAGRVAVHNFGVASIGLPEYAWLIENEVPELAPERIVVGLFVGNDLYSLAARREPGYYSLQQLQLFELGRRLAALGRAARREARAGDAVRHLRRGPVPLEGTFDEETFLEIEREAFEICNRRSRDMEGLYRSARAWLERLRLTAGPRLLVALFPDEYQVNDDLFERLRGRVSDPDDYVRFYPQTRLKAECDRLGIETLDLLEPLREANRLRPVYRPRDTHWNARGNRIAGEAIADHLAAGLAR